MGTAAAGIVICAELQRKGRELAYERDVVTVKFLCDVDMNTLNKVYDSKIRESGYFIGKYYEHGKNRENRTYLKALKRVRCSLEKNGENRESLLELLRRVKSIKPEKIPKELSHLI